MQDPVVIFWFRRDLRLHDNKGLWQALSGALPVVPLFIFDTEITGKLPAHDPRVEFIYNTLAQMQQKLQKHKKTIWIFKGKPEEVFSKLLTNLNIKAVYTNKDHEPYGIARDNRIGDLLAQQSIPLHTSLDHLLFDKDEIAKSDGTPYNVFTPYARRCREVLSQDHLKGYPSQKFLCKFIDQEAPRFPAMEELGFQPSAIAIPPLQIVEDILTHYHKLRDYPARNGTSKLGIHLRFGTVSIRALAAEALRLNETYLNELLWREFYAMILWHYPHVVNRSFKPAYDQVQWINNEQHFQRWKEGSTGYPMVDAGMRELAATGYMHNRVRMIAASFLTKHLLIDWRWGEAWFAEKLLDFELSSNNGSWQWSAGSGCDAAPYFRIFNPTEQQKKFDPKGLYVSQWIPELYTPKYPGPMVDHKMARERCLKAFKTALNSR
ncbi:MAG: cryptochrome/photolyase family protein [Bacteroidales bacterium]